MLRLISEACFGQSCLNLEASVSILFYVSVLLSFLRDVTRPRAAEESEAAVKSIQEALDEYDLEHAFARRVIPPEEERARLTATRWEGGYRWFRTPNVVCLEKARKLKTEGRI